MVFGGLYEEEGRPFSGRKLEKLKEFLQEEGLSYDDKIDYTLSLVDQEGEICASGSISGNVLKCIAVSEKYQGEGLSARLLTGLSNELLKKGIGHVFLFTKPKNRRMFEDLGMYGILETSDILFMENRRNGIASYMEKLKEESSGAKEQFEERNGRKPVEGAIVANCNPFTLGHRYLIETALSSCDLLHLFILSEDASFFSSEERFSLVKEGIRDLKGILLHETSDYLISKATFPTYFIKDKARAAEANCELDLRIFAECIAKPLGITKRFVGEEPADPVTAAYNEAMHAILPSYGIEVVEIPRLKNGEEPVSAGSVRKLLAEGNFERLGKLVPESTLSYLEQRKTQ